MKIQKIALLSILFLLIISNTFPQTAKMKFEYLTADKGLASNRVRDILRDSKGYLWIVCEGGLSRYDGYTTRTFSNDLEDSTSLSDNVPFCIFEDSQKTLWVGTSNGLNVFNPDYETFQRFYSNPDAPNSLSANFIFDITEDKAGNVWIATNNGLNLWNRQNNDFKRFFIKTEEKHLTSNSINSVFIDNKNKIFVSGASKYIFQFNPQNGIFTKINNEPDTLPGSVNKFITVDNANILWIATNFSGLYHFDLTTKKLFKYSTNGDGTGTNLASLEGVLLLNNNYLYIPVNHGGINIMNLKTRKFDYLVFDENAENGLNNSGIWKLYQDTEKILWVGTSAGGVNYFNPKMERFNTFRHSNKDANSLIYNTIYTLFEDSYGLIWIGTDGGGISVYDPQKKTFTNYKHEPDNSSSLSGNAVLAFTEDKDHDIWIGTWDCGLNRFDRKTGKFITYMHDPKDTTSISVNQIMALKTDVNGLIWISAYNNGIDVFDKNKGVIKRYTNNSADNHSLSNKFIGRIIIQPDGVLGFVTGNGYCTYDSVNDNFKRIAAFDGYSLHDLYIDSKGNYWGTTLDKGVIVLTNDGKTLKYNKKNSLNTNFNCGILEDSYGNIWISSSTGLSKFTPSTNKFRHFDETDGLQGKQFNKYASIKTRNGEFYFGGFDGFNLFNPDSLKDNDFIPNVVITEFQIFNQPIKFGTKGSPLMKHISQTTEIVLSWRQSVFSFGFVALNLTYPEKNKYAYKMHGFDDEWNYTDASRRFATYTNLEPGEYIFQVKASNNDEIWNETGTSIKIIITPPYWKTWWFRTLVILCITGLAIGYYRFKVSQLKAQKRILEQKVRKRTAELQEANAQLEEKQEEIMQQAEELRAINDELENKNNEIGRSYRIVNHQNENIKGSIRYAQTIQEAILISKNELDKHLDNFLIYKPKDIVSGDFYWFYNLKSADNKQIRFIAVVDCTGHGVPGAFMSLIGNALLNQILIEQKIFEPAKILFELNISIKIALKQEITDNDDGMDICFCRIEKADNEVTRVMFAGGRRPLYCYKSSDKSVSYIKGDLQSIGSRFNRNVPFTEHEISVSKDDVLYLSSDGYCDQPNSRRKSFGSRRLIKLLANIGQLPLHEQQLAMEDVFDKHRENEQQRDDVTVLGIKI